MIYLDHAAATPVSSKALAAMLPYFSEQFFNPSAPYLPAKHVREAYETAKDTLAHTIGAKGADLVITAGATESINLAFTAARPTTSPKAGGDTIVDHNKVLVLATEHAAVLEAAKSHPCVLINVDKYGLIDLDDFRGKLDNNVTFVSISLANNELGTIQPLSEISEIIRAERHRRLSSGDMTPLYLHSDASQALNLIDINVSRLGVDLLTINAAKCGGPKGVGALYIAHGVKLQPISVGGGQERGLRSGTENVPGLMGFAAAASESKSHLSSSRKKYQQMSQIIRQELSTLTDIRNTSPATSSKDVEITKNTITPAESAEAPIFLGHPKHQLANFIPVCFPGIDAERLIYKLEQHEIYVSTGAACAANKGTKSHVLAAIGLSDSEIAGSLRISLGSTNDLDQIRTAARIIREEVEREYERIRRHE